MGTGFNYNSDIIYNAPRYGVLDINNAVENIHSFQKKGLKVGLCHGCFDIMHFGHLRHLSSARSLCDILFVSLTADRYVNKGPKRPIFKDTLRAELIAGLACVNGSVISNFPTAIDMLDLLNPDIFFKGNEYHLAPEGRFAGFEKEKDFATSKGIKVSFTFEETFSSTETLKRLYDAIID
jgi:cytidyltransferase-like protein